MNTGNLKQMSGGKGEFFAAYCKKCGKRLTKKVYTHMFDTIKIGDHVIFDDKVYNPPYFPAYDNYKGHVFEVLAFYYEHTHVGLKCLDADVTVAGYVHPDELQLADNCGLCLGAKGGVRGNENRVDNLVLCDYCSTEIENTVVEADNG